MRVLKTVLSLCTMSLFLSFPAYSETAEKVAAPELLEAQKEASSEGFFANTYSSVLLRNYQKKSTTKDFKGTWQARYTLGSTFFDDLLTAQVVFGVNHSSDTAVFSDRGTQVQTSMDLYSNNFYTLEPYFWVLFPATGKEGVNFLLGVYQDLNYTFKGSAGSFKFAFGYEFLGNFGTKPGNIELSNARDIPRLSLKELDLKDKDGKILTEQRSPTLEHEFSLTFKWKTPLEGLSLNLGRYMHQEKTPTAEYHAESNTVKELRGGFLNFPHYKTTFTNTNSFRLSYKFPNDMKLAFDTQLKDTLDYTFVSSLSAKLF